MIKEHSILKAVSLCYTKFKTVCDCKQSAPFYYRVADFLKELHALLQEGGSFNAWSLFYLLDRYEEPLRVFHYRGLGSGVSFEKKTDNILEYVSSYEDAWSIIIFDDPDREETWVKFLSYNMKIQEFKTDLGPEQFIIAFILDLKKIADTL
jgi:hypothetical protein